MLVLPCCGQQSLVKDVIYENFGMYEKITIDEQLKQHYTNFEKLCNVSVNDVTGKFGDTGTSIGKCITYSNGYKEIIIDRNYWSTASDNEKESLMYHELGHCALDKDHNENEIEIDDILIKESIMYPYNIGGNWYYDDYKEHYHEEICL